ncbi:hypothetical protein ACFSL6_26790 [Paenibacillus thailandensis]|uniref:Lipoprotein LpqB beta-propeller domain-containing protein n=1 Tax=Paenibacillus thailandensis TaxID=393250 RepID=A0ABW5QYF7_9BACL
MNKFKLTAGAAALCCTAMLASACTFGGGTGEQPERETIQKPDKTITVINETPPAASVTVSNIATVEDARGMNFLDDERIVFSRKNTGVPPQPVEGEEVYPNNLYVYDLAGKTSELLVEDQQNLGFSVLSPDGKHLFYKMTEEATAFGRILDLATMKSVNLDIEEPIDLNGGQWIDDSHVLVSTLFGKVVVADLSGKTETVLEPGGVLLGAAAGDGGIYYIQGGDNRELYFVADEEGAQPEKIAEGVEWIIPSPDRKQLAMVKVTSETERTLSVIDRKGQKLLDIEKGTQIFGTSWSPDGTKLAYSLTSETGGDNGVFVADSLTGEKTGVLVGQASDTVAWSPSGKKLLASVFENDRFVTSVITLQ